MLATYKRFGRGSDPRRVLLVAPRNPRNFWSMEGTARLFGARALMPPASLATLMALTPAGVDVAYTLCDENVTDLDPDLPCDLVAITGSTLHAPRIRELCALFRARGVRVALGGTYATLRAGEAAALCDHLFVGEAERTWPRFLGDWTGGREPASRYVQSEPVDLALSPAPDWSLIDPAHYIEIPVQTTRGCPHGCEFCDVIQLLGRRVRTKSTDQVMTELRNVRDLGGHSVFFSDDNFLANRAYTRRLLDALLPWNREQRRPLSFSTQITLDVADDDALLRRLADARFSVLFLGVESVRRESLAEVNKTRNLDRDPVARVRRIAGFGLVPFVGLMVGFDHDDATVFDELERFIEETSAPIAGISLVNAPPGTPLHARLAAAGRLLGEDFSGEWQLGTNVVPLRMTPEELEQGYWRLFRRIYEPRRFQRRLRAWFDQVTYRADPGLYPNREKELNQLVHIGRMFGYLILRAHPEVRRMFLANMRWGWKHHPTQMRRLFTFLGQYKHFHDFLRAQD